MPADARARTRLSRVDYTDAFLLETAEVQTRTGEGWARAALEDVPAAMRASLRRGWTLLAVRLGSTADPERVLGWEVRRSAADFVLLAARSLVGLEAEVLFERRSDGVLAGTLIQWRNPLAHAVWAAIAPHHRRVVRHLLREAGARTAPQRELSAAPASAEALR